MREPLTRHRERIIGGACGPVSVRNHNSWVSGHSSNKDLVSETWARDKAAVLVLATGPLFLTYLVNHLRVNTLSLNGRPWLASVVRPMREAPT